MSGDCPLPADGPYDFRWEIDDARNDPPTYGRTIRGTWHRDYSDGDEQ